MDTIGLHHHQEIMESESLESMLMCTNMKQQSIGEGEVQKQGQKAQEKKARPAEEVLKCPRCESINIKFCYYNNYSLSQPRYFCKSCKRYWTQGGTLRNVPVGGGCRKNRRISSTSSSSSSTSSSRRATPDQHHHFITPTQTPSISDPNLISSFGNDNPSTISLLGLNSHFALLGNSFLESGLDVGVGLPPLCLDNYAENVTRGNSVNLGSMGMHFDVNHHHQHNDMNMSNSSSAASTPTRILKHEFDESNKLFLGLPWQMTADHHHHHHPHHHHHHHVGNYMNINAAAGNHDIGSSWHNLLNSPLI